MRSVTKNDGRGPATVATDLADERLLHRDGIRGIVQVGLDRVRGGELGPLPIIIGLVVIWSIFQILNPVFLSPANLVNLLMQSAALGVIALGVACVLLLGEIDLSVGSVSGLSAAVLAVTMVNLQWPAAISLLAAVAAGCLIGLVYSAVYVRFGVPSFVITLAGLLAFLGLQLWVLGPEGTINLPYDSFIVWFGQLAFIPAWLSYVLSVGVGVAFLLVRLRTAQRRRAADLSATPFGYILTQAVLLTVVIVAAVWYLNQARGVGWMFVLFGALVFGVQYALRRTKWGRSVFAIGGNKEAARRAGINVSGTIVSVFVLGSGLAALGGTLAAGRLAAAAQSSGGGDVNLNAIAAAVIGGTSLFGGRGSAYSALLGVIVIQSISSGLTLLNLDSSFRYMITGAVLLLAVILDAASRKSRAAHGRG
ncbi:sugar ABC transporter permease [Paramicrobacterium chengjingii]|uniref:Xylose transport system permease protein XylH n=1 Tax=Paramicrobacterium chengjingii TaxID=2769067 RepID=A0ABX6YH83_9MICO|nr:sugar ABC transporter permease [Microbacterium chengjingii]QPZ38152.1 sugar ABC transporter permease [Microbacterium chengjingii]